MQRNINIFYAFRVLYNARFYYPVFTVLFLDHGLTLAQFSLLNGLWALVIVLTEVPSGALADTWGRKKLVMFSALLMCLELFLLLICPLGESNWVFPLMVANRILSGLAEASASGADEALAYDSLVCAGKENEWPNILAKAMRYTSIGFMITMLLGGLLYDHEFLNKLFEILNIDFTLNKTDTIKIPVVLTFISSLVALTLSFFLKEPEVENAEPKRFSVKESLLLTWQAGKWIIATPIVFMIIFAGMISDNVVRVFLTMTSQYFRLIELPESSFGILGACFGMMGLFAPKWAATLAEKYSIRTNFTILFAMILLTYFGLALMIPYYGLVFGLGGALCMTFLNYYMSFYLNKEIPSYKRATVLSFKGLSFNVMYGLASVLYAQVLALVGPKYSEDVREFESYQDSLWFLFFYFAGSVILVSMIWPWYCKRNQK